MNKKIVLVRNNSSFLASFLLIILLTSFFVLPKALAAEPRVYLERVGNFGARVFLDSPVPVNAYDIRISYDGSIASIDSVDTSRSIVTVLPAPIQTSNNEILIRGGSPQPFSGARGELLTIQLKPIATGVLQFTVTKATAYQADGAGTPLALETGSLPLRVTTGSMVAYKEALENGFINPTDNKPPELALVEIQANPLQYGERLLVFQAMDKESGVARYEARERSWFTWSTWREALNPFPINPGAWEIQLKAIDYNDNFALATVYQLGSAIWKVLICILVLGVALLGIKALRKAKKSSV